MKAAVIALLLLWPLSAWGHDNPTDWIGQQKYKNKLNNLCCGANDCHAIKVEDIAIVEGGFLLPAYLNIPPTASRVVPFRSAQPSEDQAYWVCIWGGEIKCFFAPIGGT